MVGLPQIARLLYWRLPSRHAFNNGCSRPGALLTRPDFALSVVVTFGSVMEKSKKEASSDGSHTQTFEKGQPRRKSSWANVNFDKLSAAFENPLAGLSKEQICSDVEAFCNENGLTESVDVFKKGALVAQNPAAALEVAGLTDDERRILEREQTHRWSQPFTLYWLCIMCSLAAAVQGMDETVNNGAQALYIKQLKYVETSSSSCTGPFH